MDRQQISLKLTLDALGLPPRLDSFADRLILQKAIYLSQVVGVQLGYHYNWYLRGPYSPALTRDAFAIVAELKQNVDEAAGWQLDVTSLQRLRELRTLIERIPEQELSKKLELLASVRFLLRAPAPQSGSVSALRETLHRFGKDYSVEQIEQAIEELKRHGLCPANSSQ
jgi:uncharacterized protein YwgA